MYFTHIYKLTYVFIWCIHFLGILSHSYNLNIRIWHHIDEQKHVPELQPVLTCFNSFDNHAARSVGCRSRAHGADSAREVPIVGRILRNLRSWKHFHCGKKIQMLRFPNSWIELHQLCGLGRKLKIELLVRPPIVMLILWLSARFTINGNIKEILKLSQT